MLSIGVKTSQSGATFAALVSDVTLRHPGVLARESVTVDQISGGRLEVGLGAGRPMSAADYRAYGIPYGGIGERIGRLAAELRAELDRYEQAGADTVMAVISLPYTEAEVERAATLLLR